MKAQIRAKTRNRGHDWPFFTVWMKKKRLPGASPGPWLEMLSPSRLAGEAGIIGRNWARVRQTSYVFFDKETELQRQTSYVVCLKTFFNGGKSFTLIFFHTGYPFPLLQRKYKVFYTTTHAA
jgi:hypothetical protein